MHTSQQTHLAFNFGSFVWSIAKLGAKMLLTLVANAESKDRGQVLLFDDTDGGSGSVKMKYSNNNKVLLVNETNHLVSATFSEIDPTRGDGAVEERSKIIVVEPRDDKDITNDFAFYTDRGQLSLSIIPKEPSTGVSKLISTYATRYLVVGVKVTLAYKLIGRLHEQHMEIRNETGVECEIEANINLISQAGFKIKGKVPPKEDVSTSVTKIPYPNGIKIDQYIEALNVDVWSKQSQAYIELLRASL